MARGLIPFGIALSLLATALAGLPAEAFPRPVGPEARPFFDAVAHTSKNAGMPQMVIQVAHTFLGRPYLASSLEAKDSGNPDAPEPLTSRLDAFDCVTLVENSLAVARAVALAPAGHAASWEDYRAQLELVRYRNGQRGGYASRMHYFSEWIEDNERRGILRDLTPRLGGVRDNRRVHFMSAHRGSYRKLGDDRVFHEIETMEASVTKLPRYVLPNAKVAAILPLLQPGDIIAFATDIEGLDVVHTGLIDRLPNGEVHLLHAPEPGQVVTISKKSLVDYLKVFPRHVGVIIARPLPPAPPKTAANPRSGA